ncbi:AmmeMemoRadiSam system protein B [Bacteroidota bacterium]
MKISRIKWALILFTLSGISLSGQENNKSELRYPVVAGSFYPSEEQILKDQLNLLFDQVNDKSVETDIAALIAPHAGYVFSGEVAAAAYARIDPDKSYTHVFVIGTSHHVMLNGASIYNKGDYQTPLGTVPVDTELANELIKKSRLIRFSPEAHSREHSIEVQLPFLQYRLKKPFQLVPLVIATQSAETCRELAEVLKPYFTSDNLFVISSDFSHFPAYKDAITYDTETGEAIQNNSPADFILNLVANQKRNVPGMSTSCCGWSSVLTLLDITSMLPEIEVKHMKYMNSGDTPYGDKERVVGYHSFIFTRSETGASTEWNVLTDEDKKMLLAIARESIESAFENKDLPVVDENELSELLRTNCGAFVTLLKEEQLRGCIGRFIATEPLYKVVQDMARAAAFQDRRFRPVTDQEMKDIDIEISVLTPLKRIYSIEDFRLGEQGIYIIKGNRSGTYLPQVAESTGWTKEEFLGHCSRDKAGIGWDGWRDADLYTYEALVFDEKELISDKK